jgi:hypothetical protein
MMWGTYVSMYWRKLGAFQWLDHQEQGCEQVALLLDRTGRQRKIEFIWTVGDENERNIALRAGVWWNGVSRPPFIGQGREREGMNEQEWPAMKVLQIDH